MGMARISSGARIATSNNSANAPRCARQDTMILTDIDGCSSVINFCLFPPFSFPPFFPSSNRDFPEYGEGVYLAREHCISFIQCSLIWRTGRRTILNNKKCQISPPPVTVDWAPRNIMESFFLLLRRGFLLLPSLMRPRCPSPPQIYFPV